MFWSSKIIRLKKTLDLVNKGGSRGLEQREGAQGRYGDIRQDTHACLYLYVGSGATCHRFSLKTFRRKEGQTSKPIFHYPPTHQDL